MRRALALLVDRAALARDVFDGLARPAPGPVWLGGPGDAKAPPLAAHDPAAAGALLDAAGVRDLDGDGIREYLGRRWMLSVLVTDADDAERDAVLASFRGAGILTETRAGSPAVIGNRLTTGNFEIAFAEWKGDVDRDLSEFVGVGGSFNFGRFVHRDVESLLAQIATRWTPAERAPLVAELGRLLAETVPVVALTAPDPYGLVHRRVEGLTPWNGWIRLRDLRLAADPTVE